MMRLIVRLPPRPTVYEINTAVWLERLGRGRGRPLALDEVPATEWDALAALPVDAVWLMGVWERSPAGLRIALENPELDAGNRAALPDLRDEDVIGSPYCVRDYVVDARFGGPAALAAARAAARRPRVSALILDYVPNHVAPDHPWCTGAAGVPSRRQRGGPGAAPGGVHPHRGRDLRQRARPVLPAVARCRAAERVLAGAARRGRRDADRRRRSVRRAALRHGDADDQRGVRADLGRARRAGAGRGVLAGADRARQGGASRTCCSSPRRTGTWSGRSSSRASTSATTSASTTASCTSRPDSVRGHLQADRGLPGAPDPLHREPRRAARRGCVRRRAGARRRRRHLDPPGCAALPRRPVRGPPRAHPRVPRPRPRRAGRRRAARVLRAAGARRRRHRVCATASGGCATARAGRTTTRLRAARLVVLVDAEFAPSGRRQPGRAPGPGARAPPVGGPRRARPGSCATGSSGAVPARRRRARRRMACTWRSTGGRITSWPSLQLRSRSGWRQTQRPSRRERHAGRPRCGGRDAGRADRPAGRRLLVPLALPSSSRASPART